MQYVPPYGVSDPNASYVNGDPTIGRQGSIPPAAVFENPQREIIEVINDSGLTPSAADLTQLTVGIRSQFLNYAEDTGSVDHLSVAYHPPIGAYNKGLTLHVRVKNTSTGGCDIDAGAGRVPIRKMNGADVAAGDLPAGGMATLVNDGTVFQLTNYGGAGGGTGTGDVFTVKIPYTVDSSVTPGVITAAFTPPITSLVAGDMLAVKVANTSPGPTVMHIDALAPVNLAPNGGGPVLQGDVHIHDVVIFFYDGTNLYFGPNPEIDASITYTIGSGQQYPDVPTAINVLRRKTIGANGFVTLKMSTGVFAPFVISHPSADRIAVRGTLIGTAPAGGDYQKTGPSAAQRANDAIYNINMLRTKMGTEVRVANVAYPSSSIGIQNNGPGNPQVYDILITGNQLPTPDYRWSQGGVAVNQGTAITCQDVVVWGCQIGFLNNGQGSFTVCCAANNTSSGFVGNPASPMWLNNCQAYGNSLDGLFMGACSSAYVDMEANGRFGMSCGGGSCSMWWSIAVNNGAIDVYAVDVGVILFAYPTAIASVSPPFGVVGNQGALCAITAT